MSNIHAHGEHQPRPPAALSGVSNRHSSVLAPPARCADPGVMALWLADNVHQIAKLPAAGDCFAQIHRAIQRVEYVINRPIQPKFTGVCNTLIDGKECSTRLYAHRDAIEVTCTNRACRTIHNAERIFEYTIRIADHQRYTREELLVLMDRIGEHVPERTFRDWRLKQKLRPTGFTGDSRRVSLRHRSSADEPVFRLSDVRRLRNGELTEGKAG